jgi:hypothetical protein
MRRGWVGAGWAAGAVIVAGLAVAATSGSLSAQQNNGSQIQPSIVTEEKPAGAPAQAPQASKPAKSKRARVQPPSEPNPDLDAADQLAPSQISHPLPAAAATPTPTRTQTTALSPPSGAAAGKPSRSNSNLVVACSGAFAKDSSHLKLTMTYDLKNVDFTEVDAGSGKTMASILYPKDPKKRLEVWWMEPEKRKDTYLIAINGHSTWAGPDGLRLGLTLADLEKLNRRPFKVRGFDKDGMAAVTDWDGGTLATLPGGCKAGVMLRPDAKAPPNAVAAMPAEREFSSAYPALRVVNPAVSEILIGY